MARRNQLHGTVELLGLSAFGGEISPLVGTLIGGGVAGGTSMILGHVAPANMAANRELFGLLAGLSTAGIMFAMPSTKRAAFGAAVGAVLGAGLSYLEKVLFGTVQLPAPIAAQATAIAAAAATNPGAPVSGVLGMARISNLNGLGMRKQPNGTYLNGLGIAQAKALNGLGIASIANQPQSAGTIPGVAGPAFAGTQMGSHSPVNLLGGPSTRSNQISLMGGPQIHGLSAAYGATLLGGR